MAQNGATTADDMKKVREVDFINKFTHDGINKLLEILGVTNKIKVVEGETLYAYTSTVTLESGAVEEGEVIPLSEVEQEKTPVGTATLNKWRKATTAEAIVKSGKNEAVNATDAKLLKKVQGGVKSNMFTFINGTITGSISTTGWDSSPRSCWYRNRLPPCKHKAGSPEKPPRSAGSLPF